MRIIISVGHPAHYHLFKNTAMLLTERGHSVKFVLTDKDILVNLLNMSTVDFEVIAYKKKKETKTNKLVKLIKSTSKLQNIVRIFKPDIMIGCLSQMAWIGFYYKIPTVFCGEDDFSYTYLQGLITYPFVSTICTPISTDVAFFKRIRNSYNGFQKLAYLHPNQFTPDIDIVKRYLPIDKPYFLLRFAKLNAYHDNGVSGISTEVAQRLIDILSNHGNVYITSERELEPQFEQYRLNINLLDIHHIMAFAKLYIGDSQSMAVEAAMLGVPSIRFNSFAGKIGVLEELENKYELTHSISPNHPDELYIFVNNLLSQERLRDKYQCRRNKMLSDKIDVTAFFTWFIENYPESKKIMKENPDYQYRFK